MLASGVGLFQSDVLYPDSLRGPPLHSIIVGDVSLSVLTELGNQSYWISMHLLSNPVANRCSPSPSFLPKNYIFPELLYNRHLLGISINRRVDRSNALRQLVFNERLHVGLNIARTKILTISSMPGITLVFVVSRFATIE